MTLLRKPKVGLFNCRHQLAVDQIHWVPVRNILRRRDLCSHQPFPRLFLAVSSGLLAFLQCGHLEDRVVRSWLPGLSGSGSRSWAHLVPRSNLLHRATLRSALKGAHQPHDRGQAPHPWIAYQCLPALEPLCVPLCGWHAGKVGTLPKLGVCSEKGLFLPFDFIPRNVPLHSDRRRRLQKELKIIGWEGHRLNSINININIYIYIYTAPWPTPPARPATTRPACLGLGCSCFAIN